MTITFNWPIIHGGDHPHSAPPPPRRRKPCPQGLSIGIYNIRDGQGFRLAQAIRAVQVGGFNLMVLTETKVTRKSYCHTRLGLEVVCSLVINTDAGGLQWGLGLVVRDRPKGWIFESIRFHGPNVVS